MIFNAAQIKHILSAELQPSYIEVIDESSLHRGHSGVNEQGFGSHLRVKIKAACLVGKPLVEQHRLIYQALSKNAANTMHALAIEVGVTS